MVAAFAEVEGALKIGVSQRVVFNSWNPHPLYKVRRLVFAIIWRYAEQNRQQIFRSGQILQRNGNLIASMKAQVEPQDRLDRSDLARQVLADLAGFQHRHVGVKNPPGCIGPPGKRRLRPRPRGGKAQDQYGGKPNTELGFPTATHVSKTIVRWDCRFLA